MEKQTRPLVAGFAASVAALLVFAFLAQDVWERETIRFDATIRDAVHSWTSPGLTYVMRGITWLGSWIALTAFAAVLIWRLIAVGRKRAASILVIAVLGAEVLDQILKLAFRRIRPESFFDFTHEIGYSFPSGHSVASACFYGVVAAIITMRQQSRAFKIAVWTGAALLSLTIGTSRIYLGVHYPSDVLAGYATAVIWVAAVRAGYEIWSRRMRA